MVHLKKRRKKKDKTERVSKRSRQKNNREDRKVESNDSHEIPFRRETQTSPASLWRICSDWTNIEHTHIHMDA